jgi:AcrR family transcriptional regulator
MPRSSAETREHVLGVAHELFYWHGIRATGVDRVAVAAGGPDPRVQILAVFDALDEQVQPQHCRGCPFLMALAEFPDAAHPAHRAAVTMKAWVRDRFGQLTAALAGGGRAARPELLADQLSLVMEGTYASAQALSAEGPARHARTVVESLLDVS